MKYLTLCIICFYHFMCLASVCSDPFHHLTIDNKMSYKEARSFIHSLHLKAEKDFFDLIKEDSDILPDNFPLNPKEFYDSKGEWRGWKDFLGIQKNPTHRRKSVFNQPLYEKAISDDSHNLNLSEENFEAILDVISHINTSQVIQTSQTESLEDVNFEKILGNDNVTAMHRTQKGYVRYAETFYNGNMRIAYQEVSKVLTNSEMKYLKWTRYKGMVKDYLIRSRFFTSSGRMRQRLRGANGYLKYAVKFHQGNMWSAYHIAKGALSEKEMKRLGWKPYKGSAVSYTMQLKKERMVERKEGRKKNSNPRPESLILDESGNLRPEYIGQTTGYVLFSNQHFDGDMRKAFINASTALSRDKFKQLGWQIFFGNTSTFEKLLFLLVDKDGNPRPEYIGQTTGYVLFSNQHFDGDMRKAFINASTVLSRDKFKQLGWQIFFGNTSTFEKLLFLLVDKDGNPRPEFIGQTTGYVLFSNQHFDGDMRKAFINASTALSKGMFMQLGWQPFQGTTKEFKQLRSLILDESR